MTIYEPNSNLQNEHADWLRRFDPQCLRNWEKIFGPDPQAAMCEAATRRMLQTQGVVVEPNTTSNDRSPDFRCCRGDKVFFVECACISIEKVTDETGIPHLAEISYTRSGTLATELRRIATKKTTQCANTGDSPCLLAIGTFHQTFSLFHDTGDIDDLFYGPSVYSFGVDTRTGAVVERGRFTTDLEQSAVLKPKKEDVREFLHARSAVSGFLICGYAALSQPNVHCLLHPKADRPFDRSLLPDIKFCRLKDGWESGTFEKEWV